MSPAVSIIVPCYRAEATIVETMQGVRSQTISDWECILVSDDGISYLDLLSKRGFSDPRVLEHPTRTHATGTVGPRNRALALARGGYIADLDADDVWKPERLEKLLPLAETHGCVQDVLECFDANAVLGCSDIPDGESRTLGIEGVVGFDFPFHLVVRRDRTGPLWLAHDSWVPDVIRTLLFAAEAPVCLLRQPLLRYRVRSGSMSQSLEGCKRIDTAYTNLIGRLETGDGYGLDVADRRAARIGIERKRRLNRRYMDEAITTPRAMPFIAWLLANGHAGYVGGDLN